ncbi:MAG: glycerophosphodiester phosphodiesterase family protein [Pirellulales bacterium]
MSKTVSPLLIAHRGASFDAPENTLAAFRIAWQQGADGIETDVRLSADGRIVCFHDEDTKRVSGSQAVGVIVRDTSYGDLAALDVGAWKGRAWRGETVPALDEVLAIVPGDKRVVIEMKTGPEIVGPLADVLSRAPLSPEQVLLISFDEDVITACGQQMPQFKRHLLADYRQQNDGAWTPSVDDVIERVRRSHANGFGSQNQPAHFDDSFVARLKAAGIGEFHVWTVDDVETARFYQRLGAWAITTNRPGQLRAALECR